MKLTICQWPVRIALMSVVAVLGTQAAHAETCSAVEITASSLNVRTSAGTTSYNRVGSVNRGERYALTGATSGKWKKIWFNGYARWIYAAGYTKNVNATCGRAAYSTINIRRGPSTSYGIAGTAPYGSKWILAGNTSGNWVTIWYASEKRWVSSSVLNGVSVNPVVRLTGLSINNGNTGTTSLYVSLNHSWSGSSPRYYRAATTSGALSTTAWSTYASAPTFKLPAGTGSKRVYFQLRDASGRFSNVSSDTISYTAPVTSTIPTINRAKFFTGVRNAYGSLSQSQVDGLLYIIQNMEKDTRSAWKNKTTWTRQMAYMLSTAKHEVANTWLPITEYGNSNCPRYDGGCTYKGRGYVQLTHRYNYVKLGNRLGVNLVDYPARALDPSIAWNVMSEGMFYGLFTSRALGDYVYTGNTDYYNARRVVNGLDKASLLRGYANTFQKILEQSVN